MAAPTTNTPSAVPRGRAADKVCIVRAEKFCS